MPHTIPHHPLQPHAQVRRSISRIAVATMVAATIAAPTASAMPAEGVVYGSSAYAAEQQDLHGSTVHKPESSAGDRRGEGSIAGSRAQAQADRRTDAAKGASKSAPLPGPPTWPVDPKPIVPAPADAVTATDGDGGAIDWPIMLLIAGGAVALAGALVLMVHQMRRSQARPAR